MVETMVRTVDEIARRACEAARRELGAGAGERDVLEAAARALAEDCALTLAVGGDVEEAERLACAWQRVDAWASGA